MHDDHELLRAFAHEGSQEAFAELVRRKVGLVFAAALRQTAGDRHLAEDVTQLVFVTLARDAARLQRHAVLSGWLFTTTRHLAISAMRRHRRWQRREQEAETMKTNESDSPAAWAELRPVIDEALHELGEKDRAALLLRFFEGRSLAEVGATVGLAENAARMRVDRALEKLRGRLARRGITSTAAALGGVLMAQPAVTVPAGLATSAVSAGLAAAAIGAGGATAGLGALVAFMGATKLCVGAAALIALGAAGGYWGARQQARDTARPTSAAAQAGEAARGAMAKQAAPASARDPITQTIANTPGMKRADADAAKERLRVLVELQRQKLVTAEVKLVEPGTGITDEFAELFALTPPDRDALQQSLAQAAMRLAALERENTVVDRLPNGDVTIETKPYPELGGAIYDATLKVFAGTLGAERYAAFLTLGAEQTEKVLGRFGTAHRSVRVSREAADGETIYRIHERTQNTPTESSNYVSDTLTSDRFVREAGSWAQFLPADFAPRR